MYGDHIIATPAQRWGILVTYWSALSGFVVPYGYREGLSLEDLGADAVVASVEEAARSITMAS